MGFWDRDVDNSFDSLFDLNRDGVLDPVEQGFQLDFIMHDMESQEQVDEEEQELEDLEFMDEDERRDALEMMGYDPDDFDDF